MREWWSRRSRGTKVRLAVSALVALTVVAAYAYTMVMPGKSHHGVLGAPTAEERALATELRDDVARLTAGGSRNTEDIGSLERGAQVVEDRFAAAGYASKGHRYDIDGQSVANVEAVVPGGARARGIIVVGAHYDSVPGAPGADDNASGTAAMLVLARVFAHESPARTIRFVAFANEEPPHFWRESMGSLVYARECKERGDAIVAMLSLESVGYFTDARGSQKYPPVVNWFYPDTGDFIAFVGNIDSRSLVHEAIGTFRDAVRFPSEGAALPAFVEGVGWSDQWSFWKVGYRGVMVTDTAPFRNPNYHTASDVTATLDYDRLARVVVGLRAVVKKLAD